MLMQPNIRRQLLSANQRLGSQGISRLVNSSRLIRNTPAIFHSNGRMFSTSLPTQKEFLVQVPDFPNSSENRARAKEAHNIEAQKWVESGRMALGSALLEKHPEKGEKMSIVGSVMIFKVEDEQTIRTYLEEDAYTKEGAWDVKNARIWAIETGIRTAL